MCRPCSQNLTYRNEAGLDVPVQRCTVRNALAVQYASSNKLSSKLFFFKQAFKQVHQILKAGRLAVEHTYFLAGGCQLSSGGSTVLHRVCSQTYTKGTLYSKDSSQTADLPASRVELLRMIPATDRKPLAVSVRQRGSPSEQNEGRVAQDRRSVEDPISTRGFGAYLVLPKRVSAHTSPRTRMMKIALTPTTMLQQINSVINLVVRPAAGTPSTVDSEADG